MTDNAIQIEVGSLEKGILLALLYFDIFDYPLTESEVADFSPLPVSGELKASLDSLVQRKVIYQYDGFYTPRNNPQLIPRRTSGNRLANHHLEIAQRISKYTSMFPFVRSVLLSGSISKGYMDEQSDIDYFIITAPNRLWIVRTAMAFFRRVLLLNSRKYFCTNYFVDSDNLEITEKNIFTAIEVVTLKPMVGAKYIHDFQAANQWTNSYLPNHRPLNGMKDDGPRPIKRIIERVLSSSLFDKLDRWLMNKSLARWKKKYNHLHTERDFSVAFQSTKSVSRSHPGFYQKKVLSQYELKIREFEQSNGFSLAI
jgi:hypothetical protein